MIIPVHCWMCEEKFDIESNIPRHCPHCTGCWHGVERSTILECGEPQEEQLKLFELEKTNNTCLCKCGGACSDI